MAKRARGSVRPGQRRPIDRRPASSSPAAASAAAPASRPTGLSDAELARAAELEAQLLAQEKAAEQARVRTRERAAAREVLASGPTGALSTSEYAYVGRDVKDIVRIASLLIGILLVLWILIDVAQVIPLSA